MKETALYRFFDADDDLMYVGISATPWERWRQHRGEKPWWHEIANITIERFPNRDAALEAERAAIRSESPLYNIVHSSRSTGAVGDQKIPWRCWSCGESARAIKSPGVQMPTDSFGILTVPPGATISDVLDATRTAASEYDPIELRPYCHRRTTCWPEGINDRSTYGWEELALPLPRTLNDFDIIRALWPEHWAVRFDFFGLLVGAIAIVDGGDLYELAR